MKTFVILALAVCAVSAFPQGRVAVDEVAVEPEAKSTTTPVPIIKQINKVNDDGSYTFGYEAGDGSFRIEKKELNGYVKGKYGYVDEFGVLQVLEYETGKSAGNKTLGFQTSGALNPFPIVVGERTEAQKSKDREYSSVDDNEDGIPDDQEGRARRPVPAAQQPFFIPTETGAPAAGRVERI
ncbi:uncharacterized protein LOC124189845 [Daphnia pulex]|uniref:uncharacterized protein LOC124189845 n=1 Tax=Daphnia pulex TaxID=6669 RepID=UPI001EDFFE51|nr:uncharacterized protein LOC124189845 [Daphnia pulex]